MLFDDYGSLDAYAMSQRDYGGTTGIIVDSNLSPFSTNKSMKEEELTEYKLHTELDPRLWNSDNTLKEDVRESLISIANLFYESLKDVFTLLDIRFTGSEANYNYNEASDIDLHLIFDFNEVNTEKEFINDYLIAKKQIFNSKYKFSIREVPIELGAEDINTPLVSSGVYSVLNNEWIRVPENSGLEITSFNEKNYNVIVNYINSILNTNDIDKIKKLNKNLKSLRKISLAVQGEFGEGNLIFKKLRADGILQKVKDKLFDLISKKYSVYNDDIYDYYTKLNVPVTDYNILTDIKQDNNTSIRGDIHSCKMV